MGYIFFVYAGIIISGYLVAGSISVHLGLPENPTIGAGVLIAIIISIATANWIARTVAGIPQVRIHTRGSSNLLWISTVVVIVLLSIIYPPSGTVSWMPGLGLGLLLYGLSLGDWKGRTEFIIAGSIILAFSPIVVYYKDVILATGIVGLSYTLAGILSLREALKAFYKG